LGPERSRTEVLIENDPRLIGAVSGVVLHAGQRAGLSASAQQELAAAAEHACRSTFPLLDGEDPFVKVTIEDFPDRIEVRLEHTGTPEPSAGLETFFVGDGEEEKPGGPAGALLLSQVDRVLYETHDGKSRTTLVKYLGKPTHRER
jgi:hypothetical protein